MLMKEAPLSGMNEKYSENICKERAMDRETVKEFSVIEGRGGWRWGKTAAWLPDTGKNKGKRKNWSKGSGNMRHYFILIKWDLRLSTSLPAIYIVLSTTIFKTGDSPRYIKRRIHFPWNFDMEISFPRTAALSNLGIKQDQVKTIGM